MKIYNPLQTNDWDIKRCLSVILVFQLAVWGILGLEGEGADGYTDAFEAGVSKSGCTLHYVDEGLDTGEIILQKEVARLENDDFDSFKTRVHDTECNAIETFMQELVV